MVGIFFFSKVKVLKKPPVSIEIISNKTPLPQSGKVAIKKHLSNSGKYAANLMSQHRQNQQSIKSLVFDELKPKYNFKQDTSISSNSPLLGNEDTYDVSPLRDNPNSSWGSGSGTFARVKDYLLFKKIYEHVDNSLFFPSLFLRENIQGVTNARFVLNATGSCDWEKTKIYGTNAFMQLYVLSVLKTVCKQSFKAFIKNRIETNVDLSFHFEITEHSDKNLIDQNKYIIGNSLLFYRSSYKSIMEWEFGPFKGIFPVPAVYLNLPWIQENWEKIMYNKDPISEFKKEFGS